MKKYLLNTLLVAGLIVASVQNNYAQDQWTQGKKGIYSIGIGGTQVIGVYNGYHSTANLGLSINASGEYKVYKFIGLGWQTGLNVMFPYIAGYNGNNYASIGIPIAAKCNVHILDAVGGVAIANKLDVYAGLGVGGGPLIPTYNTYGGPKVYGFVEVGPQVGVRYWFGKVAVFGEFGWGATFANAGVTF